MTTNNTEGAIPDNFLQWIEETRPHDTDLDFTPAEAGYQNGYIAGAKRAYRKLTETQAIEASVSDLSKEKELIHKLKENILDLQFDIVVKEKEIQDYRNALQTVYVQYPVDRRLITDLLDKYPYNQVNKD